MGYDKYLDLIEEHYKGIWNNAPTAHTWEKGPVHQLPSGFKVLKFPPTPSRDMWTYATCGMSSQSEQNPIEIHIFAPEEQDKLVELLTVIAHYHHQSSTLRLGDTINFGQPWWPKSKCEYGLISLPYLDGPSLEWLHSGKTRTQFLWLIPITKRELDHKRHYGLESLEELFDTSSFNYVNPFRDSMA